MPEKKKMLLVIGAGASVDFSFSTQSHVASKEGFPSGAELLERLMLPDIAYSYINEKILYHIGSSKYDFKLSNGKHFQISKPEKINELFMVRLKDILVHSHNKITCFLTYKKTNQFIFEHNSPFHYIWLVLHSDSLPDLFLDFLLAELLSDYKPQSIDYYIGKDAIHHISQEHITKMVNLMMHLKVIEEEITLTPEQQKEMEGFQLNSEDNFDKQRFILWSELKERAKKQITEILEKCKIENINKSYFYNILCNHVGLDNIDNLNIITFNYDLILETTLDHLIESNHSPERKTKLRDLKSRIKHVYGDTKNGINFIRNLETEEYSKAFKEADNIYFLGFAFDGQNLKNLGLTSGFFNASEGERKVFITNYGAFSNIEFRIARLFNCKFELVRERTRQGFVNNDFGGKNYIYIAEKTITDSLKSDFFFE